jgi:hypothetical protein
MTNEEAKQIITSGQVHTWEGYWFSSLMGLSILLLFPLTLIIFSIEDLKDLPVFIQFFTGLLLLISLLMGYGYLTERKLIKIDNQLSKEENEKIVIKALNTLGWKYGCYLNYIDLSDNKQRYIVRFVRGVLIPYQGGIAFNLMYVGGHKGRWPYFIGIKTYLSRKLKKEIIKTTHNA